MHDHTAHVLPFTTLTVHKDAVNGTTRRIDRKIELLEEKGTNSVENRSYL